MKRPKWLRAESPKTKLVKTKDGRCFWCGSKPTHEGWAGVHKVRICDNRECQREATEATHYERERGQ